MGCSCSHRVCGGVVLRFLEAWVHVDGVAPWFHLVEAGQYMGKLGPPPTPNVAVTEPIDVVGSVDWPFVFIDRRHELPARVSRLAHHVDGRNAVFGDCAVLVLHSRAPRRHTNGAPRLQDGLKISSLLGVQHDGLAHQIVTFPPKADDANRKLLEGDRHGWFVIKGAVCGPWKNLIADVLGDRCFKDSLRIATRVLSYMVGLAEDTTQPCLYP